MKKTSDSWCYRCGKEVKSVPNKASASPAYLLINDGGTNAKIDNRFVECLLCPDCYGELTKWLAAPSIKELYNAKPTP